MFLYLIPLFIFAVLLFLGGKPCARGEWNDDFLSPSQMKTLRGLSILGVILHHISQKTAAPWLDSTVLRHGLDAFVDLGYFFVAVFFFASGYGLMKSLKSRENYLDGFLDRRWKPVILAFLSTTVIYYLVHPIFSNYTWYIAAILYLYLAFYLCFRFCRKDGIAIALLIAATVLYAWVCDRMVFGTWWYNTAGVFAVGVIFVKAEQKIIRLWKKAYYLIFPVTVALMLLCFFFSRELASSLYGMEDYRFYQLSRILTVTTQFIGCTSFVFFLLLIGMKYRFHNRALDFLSSISLELYLIHGLFVQLFSFSYFDSVYPPLLYVKSVPLYTAIVLALSIPAAWALHRLHGILLKFFREFRQNNRRFFDSIGRSARRSLRVLGLALVIVLVIGSIVTAVRAPARRAAVDSYREAHITFADAGGKQMALYDTGEGDATLVFLRSETDPCPTMSFRGLADALSGDCRVILLDLLGSGFSDASDTVRSNENICTEIHTALHDLGIEKDYILVPEAFSGVYALSYTKQFPGEVKGIIGLDTMTPTLWKARCDAHGIGQMEYLRRCINSAERLRFWAGCAKITGVDGQLWPILENEYAFLSEEEQLAARELTFRNLGNPDEIRLQHENCKDAASMRYGQKVHVCDLLSQSEMDQSAAAGIDLKTYHLQICSNIPKYRCYPCTNVDYLAHVDPGRLKDTIFKCLETI